MAAVWLVQPSVIQRDTLCVLCVVDRNVVRHCVAVRVHVRERSKDGSEARRQAGTDETELCWGFKFFKIKWGNRTNATAERQMLKDREALESI